MSEFYVVEVLVRDRMRQNRDLAKKLHTLAGAEIATRERPQEPSRFSLVRLLRLFAVRPVTVHRLPGAESGGTPR